MHFTGGDRENDLFHLHLTASELGDVLAEIDYARIGRRPKALTAIRDAFEELRGETVEVTPAALCLLGPGGDYLREWPAPGPLAEPALSIAGAADLR